MDTTEEGDGKKEDFKTPGLPFKAKDKKESVEKGNEAVPKEVEVSPEQQPVTAKPLKSPAELLKDRSQPPLQYQEPSWSGLPPTKSGESYAIEELKNGTIVGEHRLINKPFYVVGRLPTCDIQLEHPSLSRHHAILQYKAESSPDQPIGFYLYDLDSTHGSYHNKHRCFPKTYYKLSVGHTLKFGGSSRILIVQGPENDVEEESDLTVTQLQEIARQKKTKAALELLHSGGDKSSREEEQSDVGPSGISWGMADDAEEAGGDGDEEENPDMAKNPFAVGEPQNESLYLDDPKKTLRGWFEREGFELEYDCQEKGYAEFHCTVSLPINEILDSTGGGPIVAEATVKGGKKKEAVVQCALEACRIIDRFGLLRQSNRESRAKKMVKKWKDDDYYDSDEDEYLDRTGNIASKRQKRMQMEGEVLAKTAVDTFETLQEKCEAQAKLIASTEKDLAEAHQAMVESKKLKDADTEDLDSYMDQLQKTEKGQGGKELVSKLRQLLASQQHELHRLQKLVQIAKPTEMPKLQQPKSTKSVMIGKRWGFGSTKNLRSVSLPSKETTKPTNEPEPQTTHIPQSKDSKTEDIMEAETENAAAQMAPRSGTQSHVTAEKPIKGPQMASLTGTGGHVTDVNKEKEKQLVDLDGESDEVVVAKKKRKKRPRSKKAKNKSSDEEDEEEEDEDKVTGEYDTSDPKYATWMPPKNQTGDGKTSLNEKYGY